MHSAKWDHSVDFNDKVVGVIGTGSTSVQIVPALQKICNQVEVYMRSPTWISPPFGAGALTNDLQKGQDVNPGQRQYNFTEADKKKFAEDPEYHLDFRKRIEAEINSLFGMYQQGSALSNQFREVITNEMHRRMGPGHEKLKEFIIPKWSPGCRRISPGDGYLEALVQDNVSPVFEGIRRVVPDGIETVDGKVHKMDILVCATGFKVAFQPAFTVINGQGKSIKEDWTNGPNLYFGVSAPRFPNYYTIVGPGATWSNGTLIPSIETTIEYSIKCMKKMQTEGIKAMAVKQEALDEIYAHFDTYHKTTVWQEECRSWFKDGKIKNRIYLWPGAVSLGRTLPSRLADNPAPALRGIVADDMVRRRSISLSLSKTPASKTTNTHTGTRTGSHIWATAMLRRRRLATSLDSARILGTRTTSGISIKQRETQWHHFGFTAVCKCGKHCQEDCFQRVLLFCSLGLLRISGLLCIRGHVVEDWC